MNDLEAFGRLLEALRPWLPRLVVVGGWAHHLHRYHPLANPPSYLPLLTRDADVAFSPAEPIPGNMAMALIAAGFVQEFTGGHDPPVSRYRLGQDRGGFYAEVLAPLHGSGVKRNGTPDATVLTAGVTAQKLRYVDLLLVEPFVVKLGREIGFPLEPVAEVQVANPVSFIAQKLLIHLERRPEKRPQDLLYVHDTLETFAPHLDEFREVWREDVRPSLPARTANKVEHLAREQFREVTDAIRTAARIPQDRTLTPERVRALCAYGLDAIFGNGDS